MRQKRALSELRAGVIGTGCIGPVRVEAFRRLGARVTALCGAPGRAEAWVKVKYGEERKG